MPKRKLEERNKPEIRRSTRTRRTPNKKKEKLIFIGENSSRNVTIESPIRRRRLSNDYPNESDSVIYLGVTNSDPFKMNTENFNSQTEGRGYTCTVCGNALKDPLEIDSEQNHENENQNESSGEEIVTSTPEIETNPEPEVEVVKKPSREEQTKNDAFDEFCELTDIPSTSNQKKQLEQSKNPDDTNNDQ